MALNVQAKRRFASPDKGNTKYFHGLANFGGVKTHKGHSPTGFLWNP